MWLTYDYMHPNQRTRYQVMRRSREITHGNRGGHEHTIIIGDVLIRTRVKNQNVGRFGITKAMVSFSGIILAKGMFLARFLTVSAPLTSNTTMITLSAGFQIPDILHMSLMLLFLGERVNRMSRMNKRRLGYQHHPCCLQFKEDVRVGEDNLRDNP